MQMKQFLMDVAGDGGAGGAGAAAGGAGAPGAGGGSSAPGAGAPAAGAGAPAAGDWVAGIADEGVRGWVTSKGFKDVGSLANSALNLEKLTGDLNSIVKLPKDRTAEAMAPVYDRLGRPKLPAEYGLKALEGTDGKFLETAGKWFHEAGLNGEQARAINEKWNGYVDAANKSQKTEMIARDTAQIEQLKKDWGAEFAVHEQLVDTTIQKFGMTPDQLIALKTAMGPAAAMKFVHNIGKGMGVEGNLVSGEGGGGFKGGTAEQARAQIGELRKDASFVKRFQSGDVEARKEMKRLHELGYPGDVHF